MKETLKTAVHTVSLVLGCALFSQTVSAQHDGWTTDFDAALKQAAKEKKGVYVNFTGTDW